MVNDSLALVDFANRRRLSGMPALTAVYKASIHRFRPIKLTILTPFVGQAPHKR